MPFSEDLFFELFNAKDESQVQNVLEKYPAIFDVSNWKPLGQNQSNYGIVKNQQSNPIAALIEKVTNSIDAILTKRCLELGIDPKTSAAPQSMEEAIDTFFPYSKNWDLASHRRKQSEEIQIIADGEGPKSSKPHAGTSVIVYDNGEGQNPDDFEKTFLSLVRGNKNDIHFVQGKYNMGGTGAIVFCGKKRYHLIASKRYTGGNFGFTLIREHPKTETDHAKETWYEYLTIDGQIPSFPISELDLGLEGRKFKTGTILKLYSYQFPKGYSAFSQDLNQSINEYLYNPALPALTKDTSERYPNNKVLVTDLYGLKKRLYKEEEDYLEDKFSLDLQNDELFGKAKVTCFVFKTKVKDNDLKRSKEIIHERYFKNSMAVLFSLNGQVHGHYTSEFITRSLKLNLLKNHLLIHVDCTEMNYDFRKELFMASRDRLKDGEETQQLRWYLASELSKADGRLAAIEKRRKQASEVDTSADTEKLLKDFTRNMPIDSELMKLLGQTFKLDLKKDEKKKNEANPTKPKEQKDAQPFLPNRFPTLFRLKIRNDGETNIMKVPLGSERAVVFETDTENDYFDRIDEPGELKLALVNFTNNDVTGGNKKGIPNNIKEIFNITQTSPNNGTIKIYLSPKNDAFLGDAVQVKATLTAPGEDFDQLFWVKITDKDKQKEKAPKAEENDDKIGLPPLVFAYQNAEGKTNNAIDWDAVGSATGMDMDHKTVMVPQAEGDNLTKIFVNMDSSVLMNFKSKYKNPNQEQIEIANRKYYTSVYFHTLFLYTITKNRGYEIHQKVKGSDQLDVVDVGTYLKDVFENYYSTFILNFGGINELMVGVGE
jgi:hypothetical protein